jgi:hypothetical protein
MRCDNVVCDRTATKAVDRAGGSIDLGVYCDDHAGRAVSSWDSASAVADLRESVQVDLSAFE